MKRKQNFVRQLGGPSVSIDSSIKHRNAFLHKDCHNAKTSDLIFEFRANAAFAITRNLSETPKFSKPFAVISLPPDAETDTTLQNFKVFYMKWKNG